MKKFFFIMLAACCIFICGGCKKEAESVEEVPKKTVTTLDGTKWFGVKEKYGKPEREYYEATIKDGVIEITFTDKRGHKDPIVWWYGPYVDPESETDSFSWACEWDSEKISSNAHYGSAIVGFIKTIYYSDGKLSFLYNDAYNHDEINNPWIILEQVENSEDE